MNKKLSLTNLIAFYHEMTGMVDEEGTVDGFHLDVVRLLTMSPITK